MKKITKQSLLCSNLFKISLKMKFTTLLLVFSLFEMHATGYSQNTKISLNVKNANMKKVPLLIEWDFLFMLVSSKY